MSYTNRAVKIKDLFYVLVGFFLIWLLLSVLLYGNESHYSPGHWYPTECCSKQDCKPIPKEKVRLTDQGWLFIPTQELIPFGDRKERRSLDGRFHRCSLAYRKNATPKTSNRTICLFVPGQVM